LDLVPAAADSVALGGGRWLLAAQVRTASGIPLAGLAAAHLQEQDEIQAALSAAREVPRTPVAGGIPLAEPRARPGHPQASVLEASQIRQALDSTVARPLRPSDIQHFPDHVLAARLAEPG
jgi:hypothetical protein